MLENIKGKRLEIVFQDEKIKLPEDIDLKIKNFWEEAISETPHIWNGEIMYVNKYFIENGTVYINCKKTDFAHHLYDERVSLPKEYACTNLSAGCLLETSDNYYIIGELAPDTSFPYCLQVSGGNVDIDDIKEEHINIFQTIIRECKEELNIDLENKNQVKEFEIRYITKPTKSVKTYLILAKSVLNMTKEQVIKHYEKYLKYLIDNDLEVEFSNIYFIKKDNISEELDSLDKPKRDYLKTLLELDSVN